jgi:3-hydroxyisobutyrate dehydrogenase-like beta-hydroxyacid dehydrogenase
VIAAVLGLGEAGTIYAGGLAEAGWEVRAFDPQEVPTPAQTIRAADVEDALRGARVVLSLTGASAAFGAARAASSALRPGMLFADLNTSAPEQKRLIEAVIAPTGAAMADIAVLAAVPRYGIRTPLMASGSGAQAAAASLTAVGAPVEVLEGPVGAAAGRKLLRSVFMKGLAALALEGMAAAEAAGCEDWMRGQIAAELGPQGEAVLNRLIEGTTLHAERRAHEVQAARTALKDYGVPTHMCDATLKWLEIAATRSKVRP